MCEEKTGLFKISNLIGQRVNYIGRASNMLDLHFGEDVIVTDSRGEKRVGTYSLHVQCPWRIINLAKGKSIWAVWILFAVGQSKSGRKF